jgi:pyochelin synthetase
MNAPVLGSLPEGYIRGQIRRVWAELLQNDNFADDDSFLDLGGDSMTAMLCISRIRDAVGAELTIEDFFYDNATVSAIAASIERTRQTG